LECVVREVRRRVGFGVVGLLVAAWLTAVAGPAVAGPAGAGPSAADEAAAPAPVGRWRFDEGAGTVAADSAGDHPATLAGDAGWGDSIQGPSSLAVNGTGFADTGAPAFDPTGSFTVSTWVRLTTIAGFQTAVSIDGDQVSSFYLGLRDDTRRFAFVRLPADAAAGAPAFPSGTSDPAAGQWYQLTGVHDAATHTLALYVNGQLQATTPAPSTWQPGGHLVIGRARFGGNPVDFVRGNIDDVRVYGAALTAGQVSDLAISGSWRLDEGGGVLAADSSAGGHDGKLVGGAGWTAGAVGPAAATFDGSTGSIDVAAPVVDTAQSFSVAAWVRPEAAGFRTAVSVDGSQVSGFFLQQRGDGRYAFAMLASDSTAAGAAVAEGPSVALGQWVHLVGVYDRPGGTVALYVNGTLAQRVAAPAAWRAAGHFAIGRGRFGGAPTDFWAGAVDDVRTYPFPLDAGAAQGLATSGSWHFDEGAGTAAHDSSPAGTTGLLRGGAGWTAGAAGSAVALDGTGDVTMGAAPGLGLGTGSGSVTAWFKSSSPSVAPVVGRGTADSGYQVGLDGGHVTMAVGAGTARVSVASAAGGFADGGWHPVTAVLDRTAGRLRLYLDGEAVAVTTAAGSCGTATGSTVDISGCAGSADSDADFTVGSAGGAAPRLTGAVDEVSVVRYVLTDTQIAALHGASQLGIDATDIRATTRSTTYGSILEDISHSVEGGLWAELVRNRTFKDPYQPGSGPGNGPVPYWSVAATGGAAGTIAVDRATPLSTAIDRSLQLHVSALPAGGRLGISNVGFYGVSVTPSTVYKGSFWAKSTVAGAVRVSLEKPDGTVLASTTVRSGLGPEWTKSAYTIRTPAGIAASTDNRIVVSVAGAALAGADVWLQEVSLLPPTFKNRANGARRDIAQKLADLHLGLFRIPGGNYLEGNTPATRFDWRSTIGPMEDRPGHQNTAWGYWSTDGFGINEYLQLAEDIGAQPLLAVFAGYTLNGQHTAEDQFEPVITDALDEIEYAIGDTSTTWGARRAADGHPAPYNVQYVEVGNEDWFDGSGSYAFRFSRMFQAIKAKYPQLKVISTTGGYQGGAATSTSPGTTPDLFDDHYYNPPSWFVDNSTRYDRADRSGPQVLIGEYGGLDGSPTGTLRAAVGEAAFLTGVERNSDIVIGSMYAPVIVHTGQPNWPTNLIGIDAAGSFGSPSYWMQKMFSTNLGKQVVGSRLAGSTALRQVVTKTTAGGRTTFFVKLVNPSNQLQSARLSFNGIGTIDGTGTLTRLTGDPAAMNSIANPTAVVPTTTEVTGLGLSTRLELPAMSVTVLRVTGR
jgi:alpha-L-arabinofuranosidase